MFDYSTDEEDRRQRRREERAESRRELEAELRGNGIQLDPDPDSGWWLREMPDPVAPDAGGAGDVDVPASGWSPDLGDDLVVALLVVVGFVVFVGLAWWVVVPLALVVLDAVVVAAILIAGVIARVVLRRPWTVTATSSAGHRLTRSVVGWRTALRCRDEMVIALRQVATEGP